MSSKGKFSIYPKTLQFHRWIYFSIKFSVQGSELLKLKFSQSHFSIYLFKISFDHGIPSLVLKYFQFHFSIYLSISSIDHGKLKFLLNSFQSHLLMCFSINSSVQGMFLQELIKSQPIISAFLVIKIAYMYYIENYSDENYIQQLLSVVVIQFFFLGEKCSLKNWNSRLFVTEKHSER